ncbi:hypothetical protein B9Z65_506 [Elsinoe australis]|uniref:Uncharacterized protein n=1 Tax=Elsinoe australis TaxID=40998 RepID=A0A2P8AIS6_9PEZI|nr:hypothetical protein B9Z65_506 [Elsinoe australis]
MSHANYITSSFSNPYHTTYGAPQNPFSYPQQSYVAHQMPLGQGSQHVPTHYQQPMAHPLQSYQPPPPPISPSTSRKRGASEMETPTIGSNVGATAFNAYPMSTQGMMGAPPLPPTGQPSGLGITTVPSQSLEGDPSSASQAPETPAPPIKKGRTNTPWTPAEEQRLKQMRETGNSWSEIAKTFPNRTEGSVKKHWYKDMHYAEFGEDEGSFKAALISAIKEYEQNKWKTIGQKVGKPAKSPRCTPTTVQKNNCKPSNLPDQPIRFPGFTTVKLEVESFARSGPLGSPSPYSSCPGTPSWHAPSDLDILAWQQDQQFNFDLSLQDQDQTSNQTLSAELQHELARAAGLLDDQNVFFNPDTIPVRQNRTHSLPSPANSQMSAPPSQGMSPASIFSLDSTIPQTQGIPSRQVSLSSGSQYGRSNDSMHGSMQSSKFDEQGNFLAEFPSPQLGQQQSASPSGLGLQFDMAQRRQQAQNAAFSFGFQLQSQQMQRPTQMTPSQFSQLQQQQQQQLLQLRQQQQQQQQQQQIPQPQLSQPQLSQQQQQQQHHHHHRLPTTSPPSHFTPSGERSSSTSLTNLPLPGSSILDPSTTTPDPNGGVARGGESSHVKVVGRPGMPSPAAKPKGPKIKFTPEDDALLVELKETKNLTWKQIADFFPGRSSGTLQVRYCTKLKEKRTEWSGEMVEKLKIAMRDYENDRWRVISNRVGLGVSAAACKEKALELEELERLDQPQMHEDDSEDEEMMQE